MSLTYAKKVVFSNQAVKLTIFPKTNAESYGDYAWPGQCGLFTKAGPANATFVFSTLQNNQLRIPEKLT